MSILAGRAPRKPMDERSALCYFGQERKAEALLGANGVSFSSFTQPENDHGSYLAMYIRHLGERICCGSSHKGYDDLDDAMFDQKRPTWLCFSEHRSQEDQP
jgi:hypothetical protein